MTFIWIAIAVGIVFGVLSAIGNREQERKRDVRRAKLIAEEMQAMNVQRLQEQQRHAPPPPQWAPPVGPTRG